MCEYVHMHWWQELANFNWFRKLNRIESSKIDNHLEVFKYPHFGVDSEVKWKLVKMV